MSKIIQFPLNNAEQQPLKAFTERAYLDYSMYVILDRALPHLADGLKPVQRRIIYAMSELGLGAVAKYKKSARTIGDVLGKFHPHGESACYEAMVLMAQPFSYRYPLIDGQGNWGSSDDPKSFAAMRYTEARMSKYAEVLLAELGDATVEWIPNFDGTLDEPRLLPARLPNILLNGTTGIAVGMATDIPPHNLNEITAACIHLLENSKASVADLMKFVLAPDYPTDAEIITPRAEIAKMYETGNGSIRMRATYVMEEGDVIITALPHAISGSKILEQIAALMQAKKLSTVADLRDESDHENPVRLVISPRSNRIDIDELMTHLFAATDLETTYRVNVNVIGLNGRPQVKDLKSLLGEWLQFRIETVRKRLTHRFERVNDRLHILDGYLIAFLNIDEVIAIIRHEEHPKSALMKRFKLSDRQAEAILELKLRHLAKLEETQIQGEQKALSEEREYLEKTLSSEQRLKTLVKRELEQDAKTYGDPRRTKLVERAEAKIVPSLEKGPVEPITVILSMRGWIRSAKGHEIDPKGLSYKTGDEFKMSVLGRSDQPVVFMDSTGRSYTVNAQTLPSARGQGEPLTTKVSPPDGATFEAVMMGSDEERYVMLSDAGYGFIVPFSELLGRVRAGKAIVKVPEGKRFFSALKLSLEKTALLVLATSLGKLLIQPVSQIPEMTKGKGSRLIHLGKEETLVAAKIIMPKDPITIIGAKKPLVLSPIDWKNYVGELGGRGIKLPKSHQIITSIQ